MGFSQFLSFQVLHFMMYLLANQVVGLDQSLLANLIMNFLTFFFSALLITLMSKEMPDIIANVLSISLSFNTMTFLLAYAAYIPFPSWKMLLFDYALVSSISLIGVFVGLKVKNRHDQ